MRKSFKLFLLAVLSVFTLTACDSVKSIMNSAGNVADTREKQIQSFCLSAAILNKTITKQADNLSLERLVQVKTVNDTIIYPICASQTQPEWEELMIGRLEQAIEVLKGEGK